MNIQYIVLCPRGSEGWKVARSDYRAYAAYTQNVVITFEEPPTTYVVVAEFYSAAEAYQYRERLQADHDNLRNRGETNASS